MSPVSVSSIGEYIRQQREQAKISLRQLASAAGISNPYLSQVERGLRRPSAEILQQIAKGLRISAEALYVQAGIMEDRRPDSGVRAAVLADPELAERQKQVLLEVYESFRRETAQNSEAAPQAAADAEAARLDPRPPRSAGTGARRTGARRTGPGMTSKGSTGKGSTGPDLGTGPAPATGRAAETVRGVDGELNGTGEESSGTQAPAHNARGPAPAAGQGG